MSGIGEPPAGGVSTVRGMVCVGSHSSTLVVVPTSFRALFGNFSGLRVVMAEYERRSFGSIPTAGLGKFIRGVPRIILAGSFAGASTIVQATSLLFIALQPRRSLAGFELV